MYKCVDAYLPPTATRVRTVRDNVYSGWAKKVNLLIFAITLTTYCQPIFIILKSLKVQNWLGAHF